MSTIEERPEESYKVVFEGRFAPGRDRASVQKAFTTRYGAANARAVFSGRRIILRGALTQEQARLFQQELEKIGLLTELVQFVESKRGPIPRAASMQGPPNAGAERAPISKSYTFAEIDAAFKGPVKSPPISRRYLVALLPVTMSMLLMPLIYLGITLLCAYGVFWFATDRFDWAIGARGSNYLRLTAYVAVVLGGTLVTLFLVRPFLPIGAPGPEPVRLHAKRERALFHLVERIATAVGAPVPHEILVDTKANASARLSNGVFSRRLTLTIGLPLLYGLDVQTVAGILAHEFGHFTQRWGMRAMYVVHSLNLWFHRRIHERDRWDDLVAYLGGIDLAVLQLAGWIAAFGSWLCRWLLAVLAVAARLLSLSLSRQMEFDADRHEIALVGSSHYRRTAEALRILNAGHKLAVSDLAAAFEGGKLADNLPRLAAAKAQALTAEERKRILAGIEQVNGTVFDTHPPDQARIERAVAANAPPQFVLEGPAVRLVTEIERLSRLATLQWYRSHGLEVRPEDLQPVAGIAVESANFTRALQARAEYFGALADPPQRPRLLPQTTLNDLSDDTLCASLHARHAELRKREREFVKALKDLGLQREYQHYYEQALFLRRAGIDMDPRALPPKLTTTGPEAIERKLAAHRESGAKLRSQLISCVDLQGQRLSFALEVAARRGSLPRPALDELRRTYAAIGGTDKDAETLNASNLRLELLMRLASALPDDPKLVRDAATEAQVNEQLQTSMRTALRTVRDPLEKQSTLADSLFRAATSGQPRKPAVILNDGLRVVSRLARIGAVVEGQMAEVALAAERALASDAGRRTK